MTALLPLLAVLGVVVGAAAALFFEVGEVDEGIWAEDERGEPWIV